MAGVSLHKIRKVYGDSTAVEETSLEIVEGELLALLGPSGCGKTTTLRMIAGFVVPTSGSVRIGDRDVTTLPVHKRNVGMVFQGYALFPHLTVAQNIAFGLKLHGWDKAKMQARVDEMLTLARLEAYAGRFPGGTTPPWHRDSPPYPARAGDGHRSSRTRRALYACLR